MRYWTFTEVKNKVRSDLGLQQEEFVTNSELKGYVNQAIDEAEAEIITLYEDYFLASPHRFSLTNGQSLYDLPEDIYASKIRGLTYSEGGTIYQIKKFGDVADKFERIQIAQTIDEPYYRYQILNNAGSKPQLQVIPTPNSDLLDNGTDKGIILYYIRNANRIVNDSDTIDIPEFISFIIQYCKVRCYEKEGHPNQANAQAMLEHYRKQMIATLTDKVPDGDNTIEPDLTFYWETV